MIKKLVISKPPTILGNRNQLYININQVNVNGFKWTLVNTLIIEETEWLGGMLTSAGVSAIDGNDKLPAGLWGEFKERLANHYGNIDSLKTGWVSNVLFEP